MRQKYIIFSFILSLIIAISVLLLSQRGFNKFLNTVIQTIFFPAEQFVFERIHPVTTLTFQKSDINQQNTNLLKQLTKLKAIQADNNAFKDQFATTSIPPNTLLPARIVAAPLFIPGVNFPNAYILDKGSLDGVEVGNAVVYKDIAVGIVTKLEKHFSKVTLIDANSSSFTAKTSESSALGVIHGQGNGEMVLDNVLLSDHLILGDAVVTAGSQSITGNGYPPGIMVGKIMSVEHNASALFQKARVESLLQFDRLNMVFIIRASK